MNFWKFPNNFANLCRIQLIFTCFCDVLWNSAVFMLAYGFLCFFLIAFERLNVLIYCFLIMLCGCTGFGSDDSRDVLLHISLELLPRMRSSYAMQSVLCSLKCTPPICDLRSFLLSLQLGGLLSKFSIVCARLSCHYDEMPCCINLP